GLRLERIDAAEPRAYGDAWGVHAILATTPIEPVPLPEAELRRAAWVAASVGYLAGLSAQALEMTTAYASERTAFGKPLSAIEAVQCKLVDAATATQGLLLLARSGPSAAALAYAGSAATSVMAACH